MTNLSVRTRFEIFKRDGFTCRYCGRRAPDVLLELDHIIPRAAGGTDDLENLITSCSDCNRGKSDRLLDESSAPALSQRAVDEAEERLAQARAYAEAMKADRELQAQFEDMVTEAWANAFGARLHETKEGTFWRFDHYGRWPNAGSIRRLLRRLPVMEILEAVDITASKFHYSNADAERYFFGVCWRKVDRLEGKDG